MTESHPRISREKKTIKTMIEIYCKKHHNRAGELCEECFELLDYALKRLDKCKYQKNKPTCAKCPIHCYKPEMRERIRQVMRYSGPRMILVHPILALRHIGDGSKKPRNSKK
jgi:hypothetical protein